MAEQARQLHFGVFVSVDQNQPIVEQQEGLSPTHIIPVNARIIIPTKKGPTTVSCLTETDAMIIPGDQFGRVQAYRIQDQMAIWYGQKNSEWTIHEGTTIGVYPHQAVKIQKNGKE